MVRVSHPDLNPGDPDAAERLKDIIAAYETLGDVVRRARYDRINSLFGPRKRSRTEVVEEKSFLAAHQPYGGRVYVSSVARRQAQARTAVLFSVFLLLVTCALIILGLMSDGFTRNPLHRTLRWTVIGKPLGDSKPLRNDLSLIETGGSCWAQENCLVKIVVNRCGYW